MGNRAVITASTSDCCPCIYLHWNGGRASVEGFLSAARKLGFSLASPDDAQGMDTLAALIARYFFGVGVNESTVYREEYGRADTDNHDNGVYVIDLGLHIVQRLYAPSEEEIGPKKTQAIEAKIIEGYRQDNPATTQPNKNKTRTLRFFSDPGHGWLRVTRKELETLGLADKVSGFSYMKNGWVYLEEDCDAGVYIQALRDLGYELKVSETCANNYSAIRNYSHYKNYTI